MKVFFGYIFCSINIYSMIFKFDEKEMTFLNQQILTRFIRKNKSISDVNLFMINYLSRIIINT
jgi:hypothetical protein